MQQMPHDPRHNARIIALQMLFARAFTADDLKQATKGEYTQSTLSKINELGRYDKGLVNAIFKGVIENQQRLDSIITELAPLWPLNQIAKTDLVILRIAILEGFLLKITPEKVAIDEALELAKEFANEQSRKFINGVLGNLIKHKSKFKL